MWRSRVVGPFLPSTSCCRRAIARNKGSFVDRIYGLYYSVPWTYVPNRTSFGSLWKWACFRAQVTTAVFPHYFIKVHLFTSGHSGLMQAELSACFIGHLPPWPTPPGNLASGGSSYGLVSVSVCLSSRCSVETDRRIELVFGTDAFFDLSYAVFSKIQYMGHFVFRRDQSIKLQSENKVGDRGLWSQTKV